MSKTIVAFQNIFNVIKIFFFDTSISSVCSTIFSFQTNYFLITNALRFIVNYLVHYNIFNLKFNFSYLLLSQLDKNINPVKTMPGNISSPHRPSQQAITREPKTLFLNIHFIRLFQLSLTTIHLIILIFLIVHFIFLRFFNSPGDLQLIK